MSTRYWQPIALRLLAISRCVLWQARLVQWFFRKWFWVVLAWFKAAVNKPMTMPMPAGTGVQACRIEPVPLSQAIPGLPIDGILACPQALIPADERSRSKQMFYRLQVWLYSHCSPMQRRLPSISTDPDTAWAQAYTWLHRRVIGDPALPAEYLGSPDLGALAVRGPYACYTRRRSDGEGFEWDLSELNAYAHHAGLRRLGARVLFEVHSAQRALVATRIECSVGSFTPQQAGWELAKKLALCSATTHLSLVRHFCWVHLAAGAHLALATRNQLPAEHPVLRLLWPYVYDTLQSNDTVTRGQMLPGGDFECTFSYSFEGMCQLFNDSYAKLPFVMNDPLADAAGRGVLNAGFDTPTEDNLGALFGLMLEHAQHYLSLYYPPAAGDSGQTPATHQGLREDTTLLAWLDELNRLVPGGVGVNRENLGFDGLARLVARIIYMASAQHELAGSFLWNYQAWVHRQPVRVYASGRPEPRDVYQRLVNANYNLNVHRRALIDDFSYLALDAQGALAMKRFCIQLQTLQTQMEALPWAAWKLYPRVLKVNINA